MTLLKWFTKMALERKICIKIKSIFWCCNVLAMFKCRRKKTRRIQRFHLFIASLIPTPESAAHDAIFKTIQQRLYDNFRRIFKLAGRLPDKSFQEPRLVKTKWTSLTEFLEAEVPWVFRLFGRRFFCWFFWQNFLKIL